MQSPIVDTPEARSASAAARPSPDAWKAAAAGAVVTRMTGLAPIAIHGADSEAFLHGQLSSDVKGLAPGRGHWTSYNSPKGRLLATPFLVREAPDRFVAIVADDLAAGFRRRLSMFVLRAKVALAVPERDSVVGVGGPRAAEALAAALDVVPAPGETVLAADDVRIVRLPDGRAIVLAAPGHVEVAYAALARVATPVDGPVWDWLGVRAGVPVVTAATTEQFVAQTANLDAIGALDFRKGCYPGQEIVARTQYLGRLKERMFAFAAPGEPPARGTRLFGEPFGDQAAGTVVNSAPAPGGGSEFLAVVQVAAAEHGPIAIGAPQGPPAVRQALPYPLPEPVAPHGRMPR